MILFEDKDIIVCHKPAGIPVQSARLGQKDMVSILNNHLAEQAQKMTDFVRVVHRLDQPVEGVIVFAKNQKAAAGLTKQIQENCVKKIYQAVCCVVDKSTEREKSGSNCGKLSGNQKLSGKNLQTGETSEGNKQILAGENARSGKTIAGRQDGRSSQRGERNQCIHLEDYLVKDGRTNTSRIAGKKEKDAKLSVLDYEVLNTKERYALVQVYLQTGRHHQIRVQMAHAGLPLYGDQKYHERWEEFVLTGDDWNSGVRAESNREGTLQAGSGGVISGGKGKAGLALCAVSLEFRHPATGKRMKFEVRPEHPVFGMFGSRRTGGKKQGRSEVYVCTELR